MQRLLAFVLSVLASSALAKPAVGGKSAVPFTHYGSASSTTTGAAALVFTVPGLPAASVCVVSPKSFGTGPTSFDGPVAVTLNTITATFNANQTAGTTVVNYLCFKP